MKRIAGFLGLTGFVLLVVFLRTNVQAGALDVLKHCYLPDDSAWGGFILDFNWQGIGFIAGSIALAVVEIFIVGLLPKSVQMTAALLFLIISPFCVLC